ncbi:NAD(P)-dependent oxidoreductase [Auritidibacter ignavus]|uniref:NAD(P)-dependent oxidoreductase n=1 Tax=Auritidibacter ignavus TaxID=678932 RepID=UPI000D737D42|nr:NAD(P)-dependent oxidoreductase [Auritidibacter ignavus]PXA80229.1 3-hydroxyisobutyrate dehydrogenase [Auritidibacter sp. NML120779]WHS28096.1 NAD(P)-dependent oxidoreductase [Auritidibacter ignavus]
MTTSKSHTAVAVLGTGTMGAPIARNLHNAGLDVTAWNRSAAKAAQLSEDGVALADSPADAVRDANVVVTVLKDADAVLEVLRAAAQALRPGTMLVQISTVGVEGISRIAKFAWSHQLRLVDAPVLGTKGPAENAQLVVLASGAESDRDVVGPLFDAIGKKTIWVDCKPGEASKLKVVVNSFISALTHGIAEAARLAEALGIDLEDFQNAIHGGPLEAPFASIKLDAIMNQQFAPSFTVENAIKDSRLVAEAAGNAGVWLPVADAGLERYRAAAASGHGGDDMAASYFAESGLEASDHAS